MPASQPGPRGGMGRGRSKASARTAMWEWACTSRSTRGSLAKNWATNASSRATRVAARRRVRATGPVTALTVVNSSCVRGANFVWKVQFGCVHTYSCLRPIFDDPIAPLSYSPLWLCASALSRENCQFLRRLRTRSKSRPPSDQLLGREPSRQP